MSAVNSCKGLWTNVDGDSNSTLQALHTFCRKVQDCSPVSAPSLPIPEPIDWYLSLPEWDLNRWEWDWTQMRSPSYRFTTRSGAPGVFLSAYYARSIGMQWAIFGIWFPKGGKGSCLVQRKVWSMSFIPQEEMKVPRKGLLSLDFDPKEFILFEPISRATVQSGQSSLQFAGHLSTIQEAHIRDIDDNFLMSRSWEFSTKDFLDRNIPKNCPLRFCSGPDLKSTLDMELELLKEPQYFKRYLDLYLCEDVAGLVIEYLPHLPQTVLQRQISEDQWRSPKGCGELFTFFFPYGLSPSDCDPIERYLSMKMLKDKRTFAWGETTHGWNKAREIYDYWTHMEDSVMRFTDDADNLPGLACLFYWVEEKSREILWRVYRFTPDLSEPNVLCYSDVTWAICFDESIIQKPTKVVYTVFECQDQDFKCPVFCISNGRGRIPGHFQSVQKSFQQISPSSPRLCSADELREVIRIQSAKWREESSPKQGHSK